MEWRLQMVQSVLPGWSVFHANNIKFGLSEFFFMFRHIFESKIYKTHFYDSLLWVSHFYVDEVFFLTAQNNQRAKLILNFGGHGNRLLLIQLKLLLPSTSRWILTKECSVNQFFSYTDCWRQGWSLEEGDFPNWLNHLTKFICVNTYSFFPLLFVVNRQEEVAIVVSVFMITYAKVWFFFGSSLTWKRFL